MWRPRRCRWRLSCWRCSGSVPGAVGRDDRTSAWPADRHQARMSPADAASDHARSVSWPSACRQLTDHVSVNMANGGVTPASQQGPAPAAPPPLPTAPGSARVSPEPGQQQAASRGPSPINSAAAPPGPLTPASSTQSATSTAAAAAPPPPAPAIQFPPGTPPQQQMHALIAQSEYTEHPEAVRGLQACWRCPRSRTQPACAVGPLLRCPSLPRLRLARCPAACPAAGAAA